MSGELTIGMVPAGDQAKPRSRDSIELEAEDLLRLTRDVVMTVEITPATGSRLKGSHWIAELKEMDAWASAMGLEETLEALASRAVGAAHELLAGEEPDRDSGLDLAIRLLALDRLGRLVAALREAEVVSDEYERSILPAEGGNADAVER